MSSLANRLPRLRAGHELQNVLAWHVLMLPVYALWAWLAAELELGWFLLPTIWLIVTGLLVHWGREGRTGLLPRVLAWAFLSLLGPLLVLLLPWARTRRLLVPPPVAADGAPSESPGESRHGGREVGGGIALLVVGSLWSLFWFVMWAVGSSDFASDVSTSTWVSIYVALALGLVANAFAVALLLGRHGGKSLLGRAFRVLAIMGGAVAVLGAAGFFLAGGEEPATWSDEDPAWSPRADAIAFSSSRGESDGIYVVRSDGSGLRRVSRLAGAYYPSWSPEGRRLVVEVPDASLSSLWVINVRGGKPHRLLRLATRFDDQPLRPAWSPDGKWIAFARPLAANGSAIYLISVDGKRLRRLTPRHAPGTFETHPSWSPDGRRLAFTSWKSGTNRAASLAAINVDGSGKTRLTDGREASYEPSWSADGKHIAFRCPEGICLLVPGKPGSHRILALGGSAPAWASDSNRIVYTRPTDHGHYYDYFSGDASDAYQNYALSVVDAARGDIRSLTSSASEG